MDNEDQDSPDATDGMSGRIESGLTQIHDARLTRMAIKRGWLRGQRWATDTTIAELQAIKRERDLTLRERALLAVLSDIAGSDARVRQIAVKAVLLMESQNQKDEQHDDHLRMDEGRNRILTLLGRAEPTDGPRLIEQRGESVTRLGNSEPSPQPATRKNKRRKPQ